MKPNRLSVRAILILGFAVILAFNLISAAVGLVNFNNLRANAQTTYEEARLIRELSLEIQADFLQARQDEATFLANWSILGFDSARAEYGASIKRHLASARRKVDSLELLAANSNNDRFKEITSATSQLAPLLDDYENAFEITLEKIQERSGAKGLERSLADSLDRLEKQVRPLEDQAYFELLLEIRKSEQGYFTTNNQEYVDYVRIYVIRLVDMAQSAPQGDLGGLDAQKFSADVLEHYDIFNDIVILDRDTAKNTTIFQDITIDINAITESIGEASSEGFNLAQEKLNNTYTLTLFAQIAAGSASLLLAFGVVIVLARQILRPLNQLTVVAEQLGRGDFSKSLDVRGLREFVTLSDTFNSMSSQLRTLINSLEQRVAYRTRDLNVASEVSRQITRELDLTTLLPSLVEQTQEGFGLYHVSVFLFNPRTENLLLEAGTGKEGGEMKATAKALHIDARPSLVAEAARERRSIIINDVSQSAIYFENPHLPNTQSEAAFPMVVGDELVGVLDLQSEQRDRFQEGDAQIFATLAEQIAIAVRNAQLYHEQERVAQELSQADRMKSQFLASMSHELRTPLNAIINFTELVIMESLGEVNEEQKEVLTYSLNSSKHLLQLINDVLDISKIQAGKLTLFVEEDINLLEEIAAALEIIEPLRQKQADAHGAEIPLVKDIDHDLPLVQCDRRRMRQVLLNLLSNAVKFTERGTVTLSVKKQADHILFMVADTGQGIAEDLQAKIFEPFVQTVDGIKYAEGTGLGLPISRSLVEAHGGRMWLESAPGEGSTFYFTLPFQTSNP